MCKTLTFSKIEPILAVTNSTRVDDSQAISRAGRTCKSVGRRDENDEQWFVVASRADSVPYARLTVTTVFHNIPASDGPTTTTDGVQLQPPIDGDRACCAAAAALTSGGGGGGVRTCYYYYYGCGCEHNTRRDGLGLGSPPSSAAVAAAN